jgi:hypothetical protein
MPGLRQRTLGERANAGFIVHDEHARRTFDW